MNAGRVPLEVAQKLEGKTFSSFDEFRRAFWKNMAESSYASEFTSINLSRMKQGLAPQASEFQQLGGRTVYELHHQTPIHKGGAVYDCSNILIVTPKYHQTVLEKTYHYGGKK